MTTATDTLTIGTRVLLNPTDKDGIMVGTITAVSAMRMQGQPVYEVRTDRADSIGLRNVMAPAACFTVLIRA